MKKNLYVAVALAVLVAGAVAWWFAAGRGPSRQVSQAQVLFEKNCAVCHGLNGDGKGEAAFLLQPKPRAFRAGKFRLVSSKNLAPTSHDLMQTISNGMPGTPMPSWGHLPEEDRMALADYVLKLSQDGWYDRGIQRGYSKAEAKKFAAEMIDPGDPISVPPEPPATPEALEQGRKYFMTACSKCHGENGEGKLDPTWRTAEGYPITSRNFRRGVFKGGRAGRDLFLRFSTGLPGTPMPRGELSADQVWRVVQYVLGLSDPNAQDLALIRRREITAKRVSQLPSGPTDVAWDSATETRVALMPLWWHDGYLDAVRVRAVHDGQRVAFRLEWNDPTHDVGGVQISRFSDGAGIELTDQESPPLFAMGAAKEVVNIWHWKALWDEDRKAFQDVAQAFPNMVGGEYFSPERGWNAGALDNSPFIPALNLNNPVARPRQSSIEEANAVGFGTYTAQAPEEQNVEGASSWKDGAWRVTFARSLKGGSNKDVTFGDKVSAAFAVWDGSVSDRNGQKSVSIWNTLVLEQ
jgi:mono/diheme cytochrome c family protein